MFHPPAPPPHYLPPPPHHLPPPPPHQLPPPRHLNPPPHHARPHPHPLPYQYPSTPSASTPRLRHDSQPPQFTTPRPYRPPPTHHFPRAGPSQPTLPPHPRSAPAKMDSNWPNYSASDLGAAADLMYSYEQPSPTRVSGTPAQNQGVPRSSMSSAPSSGSVDGYLSPLMLAPYLIGLCSGGAGTPLAFKVDVSASAMSIIGGARDRLQIVFGDEPIHTVSKDMGPENCRMAGGTTQMLSATLPENGQGLTYSIYDTVPVFIRLMDRQNKLVEGARVGDWTFGPPIGHGMSQAVKREAEYRVDSGNRKSIMPDVQHRRSPVSIGPFPDGFVPSVLCQAPPQTYPPMGYGPGPAWTSNHFPPNIHFLANQQGFDPAAFGMTPCAQPSLTRSTQLAPGSNYYDAPKADILIAGDMNTMAIGWEPEEWTAKRRLVKVWRKQEGPLILLCFAIMTPEEWLQEKDCVVVSCMYREDRNSCWITSVDMLYLLEAVIGQRFSVEEKNRIRRNLEGFRPQTVSKNKAGSDKFFKTIMEYPAPKPRNIEKDVKVFPWEAVSASIKKIVSKYTATVNISGEPLLYHPPSGEAGHTIALPQVRDQYPVPNSGRGISFDQSSVFAPSKQVAKFAPQLHGSEYGSQMHDANNSINNTGPYDPALMNMPHPQSGMTHSSSGNMLHMYHGSNGSQMQEHSYPAPHSSAMNPNAHWDATIDGYKNYNSPGLSYSHSSSATIMTEYPTSPTNQGYYGAAPMHPGSVPTTSSSNQSGQGLSNQADTPIKSQLEVNVSTHQSPSDPSYWNNSPYTLDNNATAYNTQPYGDYQSTVDASGRYTLTTEGPYAGAPIV